MNPDIEEEQVSRTDFGCGGGSRYFQGLFGVGGWVGRTYALTNPQNGRSLCAKLRAETVNPTNLDGRLRHVVGIPELGRHVEPAQRGYEQ